MEIVKRRRGEGLRETNTHKSTVIDKDPRQMNEGTRFLRRKEPLEACNSEKVFWKVWHEILHDRSDAEIYCETLI